MGDRLRQYWDFGDLDTSEQQFRGLLELETSDEGRAEVLTQLARIEGLAGRFDAGDSLLDEAALLDESSPLVRTRVDLERGRLRRSGGDPEAALPLLVAAFESALGIGHEYIAVDAAHMVAITAPGRDERFEWTRRAVELAETSADPEVNYWLGPLYNNLGWDHFEADEYAPALDAFERALEEREKQPDKQAEIAIARYAVGQALRELGRLGEATAQVEQAVAWATSADAPDGWFHEELARDYAMLGRDAEAAQQARLALPLLAEQDSSFSDDGDRAARLRELADRA